MVEKLSKALEGLKNIQITTTIEDTTLRKKEKMLSCALVADLMVSLRFTNAQNFPQLVGIVVESLIHFCDDKDSDVRLVADESLNRVIRALTESNILKVQVELHKEIKKNGTSRCLRAALWRFGVLSSSIRPNKGKRHVQNLIPCIIEICKREEEIIHETLATFIDNTFKVVGIFIQDNDIKVLLKSFFHNLSSINPVIRRSSAACINSTVKYCRKPQDFNLYVLNSLLDFLVPINEENSDYLVLGILVCLRMLLPNLSSDRIDEGIIGSFGLRRKKDESLWPVDKLVQIYELCLHYSKSKDHNVVTASLETLNQLLQNPPMQLKTLLLSPSGFSRSYIYCTKESKLRSRSGSEMSVACSMPTGDDVLLIDDSDFTTFEFCSFSGSDLTDSKNSSVKLKGKTEFVAEEIKMMNNPFKDKLLGEIFEDQLTPTLDSDVESVTHSEINASALLMTVNSELNESFASKEFSRSSSRDDMNFIVEDETLGVDMNIDIGTFMDHEISLNFCARHIAASFLLNGTSNSIKSDRSVRVSIKSLALSCLTAIVKLHPSALKINLAKNNIEVNNQIMSDILMFSDHPDPQIRGNISILVASFINSVLLESKGFDCEWICNQNSCLNFNNLLNLIFKALKDESSTCSRLALSGLHHCLKSILFSVHSEKILPIIYYLPSMVNNSYWLLKVKLVEVLSELPFVCINELIHSNVYQEEIIETVFFPLLSDEDSRVRTAVAESLARMIPLLYYGNSTLLTFSKDLTIHLKNCLKWNSKSSASYNRGLSTPLFSYNLQHDKNLEFDTDIEASLSRIVAKLTCSLMVAVNKHCIFGCLEALKSLSEKYPPTIYIRGWNCLKTKSGNGCETGLASNLITIILSLLVTSPVILDLTALSNATVVLGNLFAGHCICNMKENYHLFISSPVEESMRYWSVLKNEQLSILAEQIFIHLMKVLNIYSHLLEEIPLSKASTSASAATNLLPLSLASPIKKQEKKLDKEEKIEERKQKNISNYKQSTHYVKLYQLLKSAYNNYKVSLDSSASQKFLDLLESTINSLSILLEIGTVLETGRCAEEILSYLKPAISLRASSSVICVIQLLKSLLGTNLASNWENLKTAEVDNFACSLFANIYQLPSEILFNRISSHSASISFECDNLTGFRRRQDRKINMQNRDRNCLANYIRLFEPIVIKSLQLYTITNDVILQSNVLKLLNQLIQPRVNYCLLDADEIFVGFVLKQFELIEQGQIPGVEKLLPEIFRFLVLLSYEKHHSKTIMSVPRILQLCDGLMASNQSTETHCIPALVPIVEDVFLSRTLVFSSEQKELETQREVVLAKLLRLIEFHEVMNLLSLILNETRTMEEKERWKRWSRQVVDALLPLASQDKLRTETFEGQKSFTRLMLSLSPNVLRPIDPLLKILFVEPNDYDCMMSLKRWLSRITVIIETIIHVKEDVVLCRLEEVSPNVNLSSFLPPKKSNGGDPFNVKSSFPKFESPETLARFLLKVVSVVGFKIMESVTISFHLQQQLSIFFIYIFHILKSGTFHRVRNSLQKVMATDRELVSAISSIYVNLLNFAPLLCCQFSYFLALLNHLDRAYWKKILRDCGTLPSKLVRSCGVISLCDYLCEILSDSETLQFLLNENIQEVVLLSNETPIRELITTIHRRAESSVLIEAISSKCLDIKNPQFVEKVLRILEIAHSSHSGFLLSLLIKQFLISPYLALSRLANLLACRRAELLLTLPAEEVVNLLDKDHFIELINFLNKNKLKKRHYALIGLLNKLSIQVYNLSPIDLSFEQLIDTNELKNLTLDEDWFSTQIKERCEDNYSGCRIANLITILKHDKIVEVLSSPKFSLDVAKECLLYLRTRRNKYILEDSDKIKESMINDPMYKALVFYILQSINDFLNNAQLIQCKENAAEICVKDRIEKFLDNENLYFRFRKFIPCLTILMEIIHEEKLEIEKNFIEPIMEFGILCLEVLNCIVRTEKCLEDRKNQDINPEFVESNISCCLIVLKNDQIRHLMSQTTKRTRLRACIRNIYSIVKFLVSESKWSYNLSNKQFFNKQYEYDELKLIDLLLMFTMKRSNVSFLPSYLRFIIRDLIISMCGTPELSIHILKVPENCDIQELDNLENFISTFSTVSWTNRQQFEEIWMGLLSVLGFNSQNNFSAEETNFIIQASTAAVEGITTLLKNTMINPVTKKIIHHGRDSSIMKNIISKLPLVISLKSDDYFADRAYQYLENLEISKLTDRYHHGLLSVEYMWTAVKQINNPIELYESHTHYLNNIGLDLTSCVHLLMELYNQWIFQSSPDIRIITSCLKSSIVISDLFTDVSQFQWLLDFCLHIENLVISENVVIFPLIIIGCCKALSMVLPDLEMCEKIKRLMLHSYNIPCKIATIQGLLYLLQSPIVESIANHSQKQGNPQSENANLVTNIIDIFLPIAIDIVHQFKHENLHTNEEYERYSWSLVFYLLQHYQLHLRENRDEMLNLILIAMSKRNCSDSIMILLIRGTERLLLTSVLDGAFSEQVSKIALDMVSQNSDIVSRCGLQLLMVLSFLEKRAKDIRLLVTGQEDPEKIMKDMEKINILFEKLKKSYPEEAEIVGDVISYILMDFNASDVLTKVIQEFLSSQQPHLKILSGLLFKVFERAELSLLEDWVVFSLPSFIQGLPIAMSVWTLNCFFVSASNESWLRSMFPLVQSRLRMAEPEDRRLLCVSASHFYRQLKDEKQKNLFLETFKNAAKSHSVFSDLLASL